MAFVVVGKKRARGGVEDVIVRVAAQTPMAEVNSRRGLRVKDEDEGESREGGGFCGEVSTSDTE